jgi:hypothetical protein
MAVALVGSSETRKTSATVAARASQNPMKWVHELTGSLKIRKWISLRMLQESSRLRIFPVALRGRRSRTTTSRGTL